MSSDNIYYSCNGSREIDWLAKRINNFSYFTCRYNTDSYMKSDIIANIQHGFFDFKTNMHSRIQRIHNYK